MFSLLWPSWSWFVAVMVVAVMVCSHHGIGPITTITISTATTVISTITTTTTTTTTTAVIIKEVARCRAALYQLRREYIMLGSVYSHTAAAKWSQYNRL